MRVKKILFTIFATVGGTLAMQQGCQPLESGSVRSLASFGSFASEEAFKSTAYPLLRQNCATCHAGVTSPFFASTDAVLAHSEALGKVDFANPGNSRFVQRMNESHNCWSNCAQNAAEMTEAIQAWITLATATPDEPLNGVTMGALTVPVNLPTGNNFTQMSFSLSGIITSLPANAALIIDIQDFVGDYRVRNPRFVNINAELRIEDLKLLINDKYRDAESTYTVIDGLFGPAPGGNPAGPFQLLQTTMIVLKENGPGQDVIKPIVKTFRLGP